MRTAAKLIALYVLGTATAQGGSHADASGRDLYARFCASCHGEAGFGDGPVAPALKVLVPDLTRLWQRSGGSFPEERVRRIVDGREIYVSHGTRYMPVWGQEFRVAEDSDEESRRIVDELVRYLRSIQQGQVRGEQP
jgi:mono/diheme cytochrome c family protein